MTKCLECDAVALFMHREYGTIVYSCVKHRCPECALINNDRVIEQGQFLDAWFCGEHVASDSPDLCVVCLAEEVKALRAREQAVRDVCNVAVHVNDHPDVAVGWLEATASVLRALDGDA